MSASLRALLSGLIDYAGLFPPAALDLEPAIRNYAEYRNVHDSWMLGRFIIPTARLSELDPFVSELFADGQPLAISALARGGTDDAHFLSGLEHDMRDIAAFHDRHGRRANVDVYEAKLPAEFGSMFFAEAGKFIDGFGEPPLTPFYEAAVGPSASAAIATIAHDRANYRRNRCHPAGFKIRCGGVEASAFPSADLLAHSIAQAVHAGVPLKFTAGLHHPVRKFDAGVRTKMYGFFNVFGAAMLASVHQLDATAIESILNDEDPKSFVFDSDGFHWRQWRMSASQVAAARNVATSYGSCSFDEPRDDLRALGLL